MLGGVGRFPFAIHVQHIDPIFFESEGIHANLGGEVSDEHY